MEFNYQAALDLMDELNFRRMISSKDWWVMYDIYYYDACQKRLDSPQKNME